MADSPRAVSGPNSPPFDAVEAEVTLVKWQVGASFLHYTALVFLIVGFTVHAPKLMKLLYIAAFPLVPLLGILGFVGIFVEAYRYFRNLGLVGRGFVYVVLIVLLTILRGQIRRNLWFHVCFASATSSLFMVIKSISCRDHHHFITLSGLYHLNVFVQLIVDKKACYGKWVFLPYLFLLFLALIVGATGWVNITLTEGARYFVFNLTYGRYGCRLRVEAPAGLWARICGTFAQLFTPPAAPLAPPVPTPAPVPVPAPVPTPAPALGWWWGLWVRIRGTFAPPTPTAVIPI